MHVDDVASSVCLGPSFRLPAEKSAEVQQAFPDLFSA